MQAFPYGEGAVKRRVRFITNFKFIMGVTMKQKTSYDGVRQYSVLSNVLYVMKGVWKYRKSLIFWTLIGVVCMTLSNYIWSFALKFIIDDVQSGADISTLVITVVIAGVLMVLSAWGQNSCNLNFWQYSDFVMLQYRRKFNLRFMKMDYEKLEDSKMLDRAEKAMKGCQYGNGFHKLEQLPKDFLGNFVSVVIAAVIVATLNPWLLLVFTAVGVVKAVTQTTTKTRDKRLCWDKMAPLNRKLRYLGQVQSDFSYAKDVRLFNMRGFLGRRNHEVNADAHKLFIGHKNRWLGWNIQMVIIEAVEFAIEYGYIIWSFCFGDITIGNFTLYVSAISTYSTSIRSVFDNCAEMKFASMELNDYRDFVDEPLTDKQQTDVVPVPKAESYTIEFKNVWFKYNGAEDYTLRDINIKLETGKSLAIVGLNGAGKTTFIKLLCRLYEPDKGEILLNGININRFDKEEYFDLISPVFQNVELFALSLGENIAMRQSDKVDYDLAEKSLLNSGLREKYEKLPKKLDTQVLKVIYDDGIDFSGGERQKLSMSRALYKGSPIILLDEPTAALDPIAEYELYKSFDKVVGGKLAVYISHRLSSTRFCDSIVMFSGGTIAERGTHDELISKGGEYKKLFDVQAQYYRDAEQRRRDGLDGSAAEEVSA